MRVFHVRGMAYFAQSWRIFRMLGYLRRGVHEHNMRSNSRYYYEYDTMAPLTPSAVQHDTRIFLSLFVGKKDSSADLIPLVV